ncbi:FtsJ-like methyltransferase-domain-containing protein [Aspergillus varians]
MALTTARFEMEYDQAHTRTIQLLDVERGRVHLMEQLLLRIENESLQLQVNRTEKELAQAREAESDTRLQLDGALRELDHLRVTAQSSLREIDCLRRELALLNAVASDSQRLQAEKSEVEKLRSQNTSANTLSALEAQLENEKHAHERALANQTQYTEEVVAALTSKLQEARQELELERRYRQDNAPQKGRAPVADKPPVASKNGGNNKKYVAPTDLHQEGTPVRLQEGWGSTTTKVSPARLRKLTGHLHPELTIATPGAVRARDQQKRVSTLPGDKSSFSITPFLNRTTGLDESLTSSDDELNEANSVDDDNQTTDLSSRNGHGTSAAIAPPQHLKPPVAKQSDKPRKQAPTKAALDGDTSNKQRQILDNPDGAGGYQIPLSRPAGQKQLLSKKRKLGLQRDRSLFDEDEDDNTLHDTRKPGRKLVGTGHTSLTENRLQQTLQKRVSSSKRWQARQLKDQFTREAAVQGLKSRAAFKLLQGYAPGSWSQVALTRTKPNGRVLGVDIIPTQPPKGVSTIQGNFLDSEVQAYVRDFVRNPRRGRSYSQGAIRDVDGLGGTAESVLEAGSMGDGESGNGCYGNSDAHRTVDVVLSDMSAPWCQTTGFWKRSLSNPYHRMMNTSGVTFKDHAGSMDLCRAALEFSYEVLKPGGHFVCKFYQGAEDKDLEKQLRVLFQKVHRLKPESSRSV